MLVVDRHAVIPYDVRIVATARSISLDDHVSLYFRTQEPDKNRQTWVRKLNPYRWFDPSPRAIVVENLPSNLVLPMQKALVQDYGLPVPERRPSRVNSRSSPPILCEECLIQSLVMWSTGPHNGR